MLEKRPWLLFIHIHMENGYMWERTRAQAYKKRMGERTSKRGSERKYKWIYEQMNGKQTRARLIELYLLIAYINTLTSVACVFVYLVYVWTIQAVQREWFYVICIRLCVCVCACILWRWRVQWAFGSLFGIFVVAVGVAVIVVDISLWNYFARRYTFLFMHVYMF